MQNNLKEKVVKCCKSLYFSRFYVIGGLCMEDIWNGLISNKLFDYEVNGIFSDEENDSRFGFELNDRIFYKVQNDCSISFYTHSHRDLSFLIDIVEVLNAKGF